MSKRNLHQNDIFFINDILYQISESVLTKLKKINTTDFFLESDSIAWKGITYLN